MSGKSKYDSVIVDNLTKEDMRIVCSREGCRKHFLPMATHLSCSAPLCSRVLRVPGQTWYKEGSNVNRPLGLCDKCYKKIMTTKEERDKMKIKLNRAESIDPKHFKVIQQDLKVSKEVQVPKQKPYREGELVRSVEGLE